MTEAAHAVSQKRFMGENVLIKCVRATARQLPHLGLKGQLLA